MDLADLDLFTTVVASAGFGAASRVAGLSQAAISRRIQSLESELGFELFDRSRRGAHLTAAGRVFEGEAHELLRAARQATRKGRAVANGTEGMLRIGFAGPTIYSIVPAALRAYHGAHPGVEVQLTEMPSQVQRRALSNGQLDLGFHAVRRLPDHLAGEVLGFEEVWIALPEGHPLSTGSTVPLAELADDPFVMPEPDFEEGLAEALTRLCLRAGFTPRVVYETNRAFNLFALVSAGLGVAFAPASLALAATIRGVTFRPLDPKGPRFPEGAIWARDNKNPCLSTFREVLGSLRQD